MTNIEKDTSVQQHKQRNLATTRPGFEDSALEHIIQADGTTEIPDKFPDGGLKAWLIVMGAFIALFTSFGYINAFGVYQTYYQTNILKNSSASDVSWIGSIQIFFLQGVGAFAGSVFDRFGVRVCIIPATVGLILSIMLTSICKSYYQFVLAQGVLGGICQGFIFTPCMGCVSQYFLKNRSLAMGIVVAGSSLGGVIFPIMLDRLLAYPQLGFGWTVRILGFFFAALLAIACVTMVERLPHRRGQFFLPKAFKQLSYTLLIAGNLFVLLGLFVPVIYLPTYAISKGMSTRMSFYLVAILNGASFPGRIIAGRVADRLGRLNMLIFCELSQAIVIWFWNKVDTNTGLIIWAVAFGAASGGCVSLQPACTAEVTPRPQDVGTYMGMASAIYGFAGLIGPPIAGQLLERGWDDVVYFSGSTALVGALFVGAARLAHNKTIWAAF